MRSFLLFIAAAFTACDPAPAEVPAYATTHEVAPPVRMVRLNDLRKTRGEPVRVYLTAKEIKAFANGVEEVPYDPSMPDSLYANAVGYTPVDPQRPDLGGTLDLPCGKMCRGENYVFTCDCPPLDLDAPGAGAATPAVAACIALTRSGAFRCVRMKNGCTTCRPRTFRLPLGRRVFYCACG